MKSNFTIHKITRKKISKLLLILGFISCYLLQTPHEIVIVGQEYKGYLISSRVIGVQWEISEKTSRLFPNQTGVVFSLDIDIWVKGNKDITYTHGSSAMFELGFRTRFSEFTSLKRDGCGSAAIIVVETYKPGSNIIKRYMTVWINQINATKLPNGLYDFWVGREQSFLHPKRPFDPINIYHTYLRITQIG